MNIVRKPTPHFRKGRGGLKPRAIVIHISTASLTSCDNWFANPESKVSAHYCVGKRGEVHQYVDEEDTAFHAGTVVSPTWKGISKSKMYTPNFYTIGIEHEGKDGEKWTEAMYAASAELIAEICKRWRIPIDRNFIIGHREIRSNKTCPGSGVDLDRLVEMAKAKGEQL